MAGITTAPIIARTYLWGSSDSVAVVGAATDPGGDLDIDNMVDPVTWPATQYVGRAVGTAAADGVRATLNTQTSVSLIQLLNIDDNPLPSNATIDLLGRNGAAATTLQSDTSLFVDDASIYTSHSLNGTVPARPLWIPGVDAGITTPAAANPPAVAAWDCKDIRIRWVSTPNAYMELAGIALGVGAYELQDIDVRGIEVTPIELYVGRGYQWSINWANLADDDATALQDLWRWSEAGEYPVFFCPAPGVGTATGTIAGDEFDPTMRGGLCRFVSFSRQRIGEYAVGYHSTVSAVLQTWQEVPAGGM